MARPVIFLASRTEQENQILKHKLIPLYEEFGKDSLRFVSMHPQGLARTVQDEAVSVVLINIPEWTRAEAHWVRELRGTGFSGPVLVTAKMNMNEGMRALQTVEEFAFLEKPYEAKDLIGIVGKMLMARQVAQRIHRRYNTDQRAELELFGREDRYNSRIVNLSRGGAYLESATPAPLRLDDMLRLHMELDELQRTYTMAARVVWTKPVSGGSGTGIGVEFVGAADVRKTPLGY